MSTAGFMGNFIARGAGSRQRVAASKASRRHAIDESTARRQNLNKFGDYYRNKAKPNSRGFAKTVDEAGRELTDGVHPYPTLIR